uniref:Uncharacterized protein n=1 Tax=Arundo donax TaxID=35708 RepID=A0A0A9APL2_ARUDO
MRERMETTTRRKSGVRAI